MTELNTNPTLEEGQGQPISKGLPIAPTVPAQEVGTNGVQVAPNSDPAPARKAAKKAVAKKTATKRTAKKVAARKMTQRRNIGPRLEENSQPVLRTNISLDTNPAQDIFNRTFHQVNNALFQLDVPMIARHQNYLEAFKLVEQAILKDLEDVTNDLNNDLAQLELLAQNKGQDLKLIKIEHTNPQIHEVKVLSPKSVQYIYIIREFDKYLTTLDKLWLLGEVAPHYRMERTTNWRQRIVKLGNRINNHQVTLQARIRKAEEKNDTNTQANTNKAPTNNAPETQTEKVEDEA